MHYGVKFYYNYATVQGGAIGITSDCNIYLENAVFIANSAPKGGVFSVMEGSSLTIVNSTFINNVAESGGLFHGLENYDSWINIFNSSFTHNYGDENLFNLMNSNLNIVNTSFSNNTNLLFSLAQSRTTFLDLKISNHFCENTAFGCLINSLQSDIIGEEIKFYENENILEEGITFFELSNVSFHSVYFENLRNFKNIGSCYDMRSSSLNINKGNFSNYDYNCIFAINSTILINNSIFDNSQFQEEQKNIFTRYGTVFCQSCTGLFVYNSAFRFNFLSDFGGSIGFISLLKENLTIYLQNSEFKANKVKKHGGSLYLKEINAAIINCSFSENRAYAGAAIYFFSSSTFNLNIIILFYFR